LSSGTVPSSFNLKIFPDRELISWGKWDSSETVPVPTYNFPSGPNFRKPPLVKEEPGILSKIISTFFNLLFSSVICKIYSINFHFLHKSKKHTKDDYLKNLDEV